VNYVDDLHHLVREIHTKVEAAEQAASAAANRPTTYELPDGLGEVTVSGDGALLDVSLQVRAVTAHTPTSLGRALLQGIRAAEQTARLERDATIAASQQKARFS
jgi:DNA-binding protein YbaB